MPENNCIHVVRSNTWQIFVAFISAVDFSQFISEMDFSEKGRLTPFVRILVQNAMQEDESFGRITPTVDELVAKTLEDGRNSAQREIQVEFG